MIMTMSKKQKEYRAFWKKEMKYLISLTKARKGSGDYMGILEVETILDEIPDFDMTKKEKEQWRKKLYGEE